jgi:hypothetical protein
MIPAIPDLELPEFATQRDRLAESIEHARQAASLRVGYEVELAGLEPIEREGRMHLRVFWRRKIVADVRECHFELEAVPLAPI